MLHYKNVNVFVSYTRYLHNNPLSVLTHGGGVITNMLSSFFLRMSEDYNMKCMLVIAKLSRVTSWLGFCLSLDQTRECIASLGFSRPSLTTFPLWWTAVCVCVWERQKERGGRGVISKFKRLLLETSFTQITLSVFFCARPLYCQLRHILQQKKLYLKFTIVWLKFQCIKIYNMDIPKLGFQWLSKRSAPVFSNIREGSDGTQKLWS